MPRQGPDQVRERWRSLTLLTASVLLAVLAGEVLVRLAGYRPWGRSEVGVASVEPGGSLYLSDPDLGYVYRPGRHRIEMRWGKVFHTSNALDGLRITRPSTGASEAPDPSTSGRAAVWIFGGSFTYGWLLEDDETFPWKLQERFPELDLVNFGVGGYGTLHALIQYEAALTQRPAPWVVLIAYNWFHARRNTSPRARHKALRPQTSMGLIAIPRARLVEGELRREVVPLHYRGLPFYRQSALSNFIDELYNRVETRSVDGDGVTRAILGRFAELALGHGSELVLAGLSDHPRTHAMLSYARQIGARTVDIAVDTTLPGASHAPYDNHPSASTNTTYADRLERYLREELLR